MEGQRKEDGSEVKQLQDLPIEILLNIIIYFEELETLYNLSRSCKEFFKKIYGESKSYNTISGHFLLQYFANTKENVKEEVKNDQLLEKYKEQIDKDILKIFKEHKDVSKSEEFINIDHANFLDTKKKKLPYLFMQSQTHNHIQFGNFNKDSFRLSNSNNKLYNIFKVLSSKKEKEIESYLLKLIFINKYSLYKKLNEKIYDFNTKKNKEKYSCIIKEFLKEEAKNKKMELIKFLLIPYKNEKDRIKNLNEIIKYNGQLKIDAQIIKALILIKEKEYTEMTNILISKNGIFNDTDTIKEKLTKFPILKSIIKNISESLLLDEYYYNFINIQDFCNKNKINKHLHKVSKDKVIELNKIRKEIKAKNYKNKDKQLSNEVSHCILF